MVRILRWDLDGPCEPEALAILKSATKIYSDRVESLAPKLLREYGLTAHAIPDGDLTDGCVLVLAPSPLDRLAKIVDRLLGPGGCPWDREQTHVSLKKYLLEEAYEVIEAIDADSSSGLREELGDLLLQPIMHAQMKKLTGEFDIDSVATDISDKLIRRHPHVFGDGTAKDAEAVLLNWDSIKRVEKGGSPASIVGGVPRSMPGLLRASEIGKRAARCGFEWPELESVFLKLREEEVELREAMALDDAERVADEMGDLLFTVVQIARWLRVDPEDAVRRTTDRFTARFQRMEEASVKPLDLLSLAEWDDLWKSAKQSDEVPS